jgi:hypothetical protein
VRPVVLIDGVDGMRVFKPGRPGDQSNLVRSEICGDFHAFGGNDGVLVMHEVLHRQSFTQRLARHRARIDARAAQLRAAFRQRHALAEISSLHRAPFTGGARTNHDQIKRFHRQGSSGT